MDIEAQLSQAKTVKQKYESRILQKRNVVGIGIGFRQKGGHYTDEVAIIIQVQQKIPSPHLTPNDLLPLLLDGVPVDVVETGVIHAQS